MFGFSVKKVLRLPIALVLSTLWLHGCDGSSNDGTPEPDEPEGTIVLDIPDANSGEIILNVLDGQRNALDGVRVFVIDDEAAGDIVQNSSEDQFSFAGIAQIPLNDFTGTRAVRVEAEQDGFLSNGARYEVTGGQSNEFDLVLTSIADAGDGISVGTGNGNVDSGNLVVTAFDTVAAGGEQLTRVEVPQGTQITAADGTELTGDIRITVAHYKSTDPSALAAFPGGFSVFVENEEDIDINTIEGTPINQPDVVFQSAGFTAIEMFDEAGNKADRFDGDGIIITMEVTESTINPETGNPIQVGDPIPLWSFDTDTANWNYEGVGTVSADGNGGLVVTYRADHLSFWNLDFPTTDFCRATLQVNSTAGDANTGNPFPVDVTFIAAESSLGWSRTVTAAAGSDSLTLFRAPAAIPVTASFRTAGGVSPNTIFFRGAPYTGQQFNLCDSGDFSVEFPTPAVSFHDLTVAVSASCSNDTTIAEEPLRFARISYQSSTAGFESSSFRASTGVGGVATISVPAGIGELSVVGAGGTFSETVVVNGPTTRDVALQFNCPVITGVVGQE